jgi:hypothetical protein
MGEPAIGWISEVVLDGPDPWVLAAGATSAGAHVSPRPAPDGEPVPWRVYRDQAGHLFCLVIR